MEQQQSQVSETDLLRQQIDFLTKQLEMTQNFQSQMGLSLNKLTIEELFKKKLLECRAKDLSRTRMYSYNEVHRRFSEYYQTRGIEYADEVTQDHTHEFWEYMKNTPGKRGYVSSENSRIHFYKALKATFQYAEDRNSIIKNPFKDKVYALNPVKSWWDDEYFYSLIDAIREHGQPAVRHKYETIVRCLYTSGLRISLFLSLKHSDVKIDNEHVFITTKRKVPKTCKVREVTTEILNRKAREMFLEYYKPENDGYIFVNKDTTPLYYAGTVRRVLQKICKKASLDYRGPQKAKHGFVTKLLIKGYTAEQICVLTGNATPNLINQVYSHIKASDIRNRVKADIENI